MGHCDSIKGVCRHFNGILNPTCKAGVAYSTVISPGRGVLCLSSPNAMHLKCDKRQMWTPAELKEQDEESKRSLDRTIKVIEAIRAVHGKKRGVSGSIDCPACNTGKVRYSIASCNGHIHAGCTTVDCVRFMQ